MRGNNSDTKAKGLKKWHKILIAVLIVLLAIGTGLFLYANSKLNKIKKVTLDEKELSIVDVNGYANILLLGVDTRDMKNLKGSRTDAIMVVSINEKTKDVKLISVYRDTFLKMGDTNQFDKITHAFAHGGAAMTIKSINQALDLNISKFAVVNFKSVADVVDAVGGIELDIEEYEISEMNACIEEGNAVLRKNSKLIDHVGKQKVDGIQALSYARMRNGVGDDFKRTERMRTVVTKVFEKLKTFDVKKINNVLDAALPQIKTNLSNSDILALASRVTKYKIKGSVGWPYELKGAMVNTAYVVLPENLALNTKKLHEEVFKQKDYRVTPTVQRISDAIAAESQGSTPPDPSVGPATNPNAPITPNVEIQRNTAPQQTPQDPNSETETPQEPKPEPPQTDQQAPDVNPENPGAGSPAN